MPRWILLHLLPRRRRELCLAMLAEGASVPAGRRAVWYAGVAWFAVRETLLGPAGYALGLACSVALLLWTDRSPSDVANQASLLVLLLTSGALGYAGPRLAWLTGAVVGAAISAAHIVYLTTGPALPYRSEPPGLTGAATLLVLVVPAAVAAYLGAGARRLSRTG